MLDTNYWSRHFFGGVELQDDCSGGFNHELHEPHVGDLIKSKGHCLWRLAWLLLLSSLRVEHLAPVSSQPAQRSTNISMLALNIVLYVLLGTSLAFAIVELGLSAYVTSAYSGTQRISTGNAYSGYSWSNVKVKPPAIIVFLVFSSCWTVLVTVAALLVPWHYTRKGLVTARLNTILAATFVALYSITMVFWLACFADLATILNGVLGVNPYFDAIIAFGVLLWWVLQTISNHILPF